MQTKGKITQQKLSDLKQADYNPREIGVTALAGLQESIEEFGDISGIVLNERTGNLVAGHQRVKALQEKYGDLNIVDGRIELPNGDGFSIRLVNWDIIKEKAANIAANNPNLQGEFTPDVNLVINEIRLEVPDLSDKLLLDELLIEPVDHASELFDIEKTIERSDLNITIGEYVIKIPRQTYLQWVEKIKLEFGFDDKSVENEILRRLIIEC